jgi:hypothetical protein
MAKRGLGLPLGPGGKIVQGELETNSDGTAKWTYINDLNPLSAGFGDRSTFTSTKDADGKWGWAPTTSTSVQNLSAATGISATQITDSLYKTPATQTVLNGQRVNLLGGLTAAKKVDPTLPNTGGTTTNPNTPVDQTSAGSQGGDPNNAALLADISTPTKGTRMSFSQTLRYPEKLKSEHQDVISFNMLKYEPRKLSEGGIGNLGTFGQRSDFKTRIIGKVTLPIPNGISDANSVTWNGETITSAQKALADLAAAGITGGLKSAADTAGNQIDQAAAAAPEIAQGLASYFTEQAVGTTNLLSRTQGAIQNPNLELLFSAPTLRPFNFTFKLASRSEAESKIIRSIIRFFKQGMSPQRSQSNLFLKAPHTFQIQYRHRNEEHKFLNKFKECALQSFNVSYTPEGQYATFTDGAMVSYQITMQFQELEPIFNDDYGNVENGPDTEIGF